MQNMLNRKKSHHFTRCSLRSSVEIRETEKMYLSKTMFFVFKVKTLLLGYISLASHLITYFLFFTKFVLFCGYADFFDDQSHYLVNSVKKNIVKEFVYIYSKRIA